MSPTRDRFIAGLVEAMDCDPALINGAAVSVSADETRAESHRTTGYELGEHLIIRCDPAAATMLSRAVMSIEPNLAAWNQCASANSGEFLGASRMQVLPRHELAAAAVPQGYSLRTMDGTDPIDVALIRAFMAASVDADLDEAELDPNNLSPFIAAVLDADGGIASYADAKPWQMVDGFGDVGLLTRPDCRGKALGSAAVTLLCELLLAHGIEPLYACDEANTASVRLSVSLGFEIATMLSAYRFPHP